MVLRADRDGDRIFCTLDGTAPSPEHWTHRGCSPLAIELSETTRLRAVATNKSGVASEVRAAPREEALSVPFL